MLEGDHDGLRAIAESELDEHASDLEEILALHTGQPLEQVSADMDATTTSTT